MKHSFLVFAWMLPLAVMCVTMMALLLGYRLVRVEERRDYPAANYFLLHQPAVNSSEGII